MKCEMCEKEHDGSYGSGRFCCVKCARGFSTKKKRKEINKKVSLKLRGSELSKQQKIQKEIAEKHASYERKTEVTSLFQLSKRTVSKILKRLKIKCSYCGWYEEEVSGDLHHIIPKNKGGTDKHDNITYICPNCHRMYHSGKIDSASFVSLEDYIGDEWKNFYYVKGYKNNTALIAERV